jgi:hypothetical protein
MDVDEKIRRWFVPLSCSDRTLRDTEQELRSIGLAQRDIPYLVQLVENPRFGLPWIDVFHGATDLVTHDRIHILLGRGLLAKDEAFVIGFTMGSTDRVGTTEEWLYSLIAKYLYPQSYRFTDEDVRVYKDGVKLGFVSSSRSLAEVDYEPYLDRPLGVIRAELGIEEDLLRAYYRIEKRRFPASFESARLLD